MTTRVLIIFGSTYGYTEQYATWLAEDLRALPQAPEVEIVPASKVTPEQAEAFHGLVIAGSDYGGSSTAHRHFARRSCRSIAPKKNRTAFFTVSFTGEYSKKLLDKAVAKSYTPELTEGRPVYHLRGGIDFDKISLAHKTALKGPVRAWLMANPHPNEGIQQMLECYKTGKAEYIDRETLKPLVEDIAKFL